MSSVIDRIRNKNTLAAASTANRPAPITPTLAEPAARRPPPAADRSPLSPPSPCPTCHCPAIWSSIYEPDIFRCCDCDPPPGGWHWIRGGWPFVARRLLLVIDSGQWHWESLPRLDLANFEVEATVEPALTTTAMADAAAITDADFDLSLV